MRILITGAAGQVARDLADHCRAAGDDVIALASADLDVTDRTAVHAAVSAHAPDVVANGAAWTAVDACEDDEARALAVNALAVRWLAEAADRVGAHLVHVSTDYVFDGTKSEPYHEWDVTGPRSAYGRSKLAGEQEALAAASATVVRTAWVCGIHGHNMVKTVLGLKERPELRFVDDQRGSPTFTADLAGVLRTMGTERLPGVVHATNQGSVTWYGFVREVLEAAGADPDIVVPIRTDQLDPPRPAPRPANSVLENRVLVGAGIPLLPDYRETLRATVRQLIGA